MVLAEREEQLERKLAEVRRERGKLRKRRALEKDALRKQINGVQAERDRLPAVHRQGIGTPRTTSGGPRAG